MNKQALCKLGLVNTHTIELRNGEQLKFFPRPDKQTTHDTMPCVYVWTANVSNADDLRILYVGKAGYGAARRFAEHEAGFRNSVTYLVGGFCE